MEKLEESIVSPSSSQSIMTSSVPFISSSSTQPTETLFTSILPTESSSVLLTSSVLLISSSVYQSIESSSVCHSTSSSSVMPHQTNVAPEPCGSGGGWTRLAYLDMSDATQNCPSGFRLYQSGGVRACGQPVLGIGCNASVQFPSNGISYSQVCGRVTGYLFGSIDALGTSVVTGADGVTISHGSSQQQIWTLMGGNSELGTSTSSCPCNTGSTVSIPSSIGNNYFCESGNPNSSPSQILYTSDPLWDGQGCGSNESPCCNVPGIPWFHRDYGSNTTTDYIELRVCGDGTDEDTPVSYYEIYVK